MIFLKNEDVLLFQGDSITHGGRVESKTDFNHVMGHGYQDFVAQKLAVDNVMRTPTILNRGVSGDTLEKIIARKEEDVFQLKPTVFSILVGTNDASFYVKRREGLSIQGFEQIYRSFLCELKMRIPNVRLIIGQPFRYLPPAEKIENQEHTELCKKIVDEVRFRAEVIERIAVDFDAIYVRYWDAIDKYARYCPIEKLVWDGCHPTYIGHGIMAQAWLESVEKYW